MKVTTVLCRTSRRGPGGWTTPSLASFGRGTMEAQGAQKNGPRDYKSIRPESPAERRRRQASEGFPSAPSPSSSGSSAPYSFLSSASFYDGGDNAELQAMDKEGAGYRNWHADPRFASAPPYYRNIGIRGQPFGASGGAGEASDPNDTQGVCRVARDAAAMGERISQDRDSTAAAGASPFSAAGGGASHGSSEPWLKESTWAGGKGRGTPDSDPAMSRNRGVNDFSMIDREQVTLTSFMKMMIDATFQPRDADSKVFGGDNRTKMSEQKEELKNMDPRMVPFAHDDLMNNYLKNIQQLHSPSGQIVARDMLKGRLVGLLFFSESERCFRFMRQLKAFHRQHSPDFVVVAVSAGGKENIDVTRGFGFFHCTHRDGATWVKRDAGLMIQPFAPLPRLVVVDGTTGIEISRSGVTAVMVRPDTCMKAWQRGESGIGQWDWTQVICM